MSRLFACASLGLWVALTFNSVADGLQNWTSQSAGMTNDLHGVTFGDGRFVAVGTRGIIIVSVDGAQWQVSDSSTASTLWGVAYGGGRFVAVGEGGTIVTSVN